MRFLFRSAILGRWGERPGDGGCGLEGNGGRSLLFPMGESLREEIALEQNTTASSIHCMAWKQNSCVERLMLTMGLTYYRLHYLFPVYSSPLSIPKRRNDNTNAPVLGSTSKWRFQHKSPRKCGTWKEMQSASRNRIYNTEKTDIHYNMGTVTQIIIIPQSNCPLCGH